MQINLCLLLQQCITHSRDGFSVAANTHRRRRRDSTVESRRRCVLNSQLIHGGFGRKIEN